MPWQPLVDGPLAQRALDTARAIGAELVSESPWFATAPPDVFGGAAGIALLFAYLDAIFPRQGYDDECATWLARAVAGVADGLAMSLSGALGVAWVAEHLAAPDLPDPNRDVDAELAADLGDDFDGHFDLVNGLVGMGCYALERRHHPDARRCLVAIVDRVEAWARPTDRGLVWWTPPRLMPPHQVVDSPDGHANLGLAHGQPGVVGLLARVHAIPELAARTRPLLDGAIAWLLAHDAGCFGYHVPCKAPRRSRAAWCYGDPGVAVALLAAREACPGVDEAVLRLARRSAVLSPVEAGIEDAGLCHGAAGLMHVYNRIAQATGDVVVRDAARAWVERTLALARPGHGIGGYSARRYDGYEPRPGLLDGAAGIALALLAASTELAPEWDRVLLLS